jgi:hypothetical protein
MADDEPELHVTHPLSLGELAGLGRVHPEEEAPEVSLSPPLSYTIRVSPPNGELISFSDEDGKDPNRYDGARFALGPEGTGSFEFMPSGTRISVSASGTMNATEERVTFENPDRGLSGIFVFPRGGQHGEVTLTHGSVHLRPGLVGEFRSSKGQGSSGRGQLTELRRPARDEPARGV